MQFVKFRLFHSTIAFTLLCAAFAGSAVEVTSAVAQEESFVYRKLAPGVLKDIPSQVDVRDSFSLPMPLPGLKAEQYTPEQRSADETLYGLTHRTILYRDVWQYDFAFTGLRQISVTEKGANGIERSRNVWYIVYRVRDLGETLSYEEVKKNPKFNQVSHILKKGEAIDTENRQFLPRFSLEGWVFNPLKKVYEKVAVSDSVNPAVMRLIRQSEDPRMPLLDAVQMSEADIPKVKPESDVGVWGVAIFEGVNPELDYVSVFVSGLTNAYRIKKSDDGAISFKRKTLQLNFWRPGDAIEEEKDNIQYGIPLVDDAKEQVLITRRYALPGPVIRGFEVNREANRRVPVIEADAMVNLKDFKSALTPILDKGNLPSAITDAFAESGITVNRDIGVDRLIEGKKWAFSQAGTQYELVLEPQYWEPDFEGIRFIKSLDFMWIYR
jgi:hypothetical protein